MQNLEQAIRERAYHLWLADGCPHGKCENFWLDAQRHLLDESVRSAISVTAPKSKTKLSKKNSAPKVAGKTAPKKRRAA